jgi:hypothetical protein
MGAILRSFCTVLRVQKPQIRFNLVTNDTRGGGDPYLLAIRGAAPRGVLRGLERADEGVSVVCLCTAAPPQADPQVRVDDRRRVHERLRGRLLAWAGSGLGLGALSFRVRG